MDHIIIYTKNGDAIERIKKGEKTTLIRAADSRKRPHGMVFEGDRLFFAQQDNGARIVLRAVAGTVYSSERLTIEGSEKLITENKEKYRLTDSDIKGCLGKPFVAFVQIKDVKQVIPPLDFRIEDNEAGWLVFESINGLIGLI